MWGWFRGRPPVTDWRGALVVGWWGALVVEGWGALVVGWRGSLVVEGWGIVRGNTVVGVLPLWRSSVFLLQYGGQGVALLVEAGVPGVWGFIRFEGDGGDGGACR